MRAKQAPFPHICQRYDLRDPRNVLTWIRRKFWAAR